MRWFYFHGQKVIGALKKTWDGVDERYVSAVNGTVIDKPVLELEDGNAFLKETPHIELTEREWQFFKEIEKPTYDFVLAIVRSAATQGLGRSVSMLLLEKTLLDAAKMVGQFARSEEQG